MDILFFFLALIVLVVFVFALVGPQLLNKWTGAQYSRMQWALSMMAVFLLFFFLFVFSIDTPEETQDSQQAQTEETQNEQERMQSTEDGPEKPYSKLDTNVFGGTRAYTHYVYTGDAKPSEGEVKEIMAELREEGCGDYQRCDLFLWDSLEDYSDRGVIDGKLADEVAPEHKEHLAGHLNNGDVFHYYGQSGETEESLTIYNPSTDRYEDF